MGEILWTPDDAVIARANLTRFLATAPGSPQSYEDLWRWSVDDLEAFWAKVWHDCGVVAARPYDRVLGEPRMPGAEWFAGATLNFAENLLQGTGPAPALIGAGEGRADELVSWDELRDRVARAQRGLRRLEVSAGDRIAAFLPNCVDAVVLMLAATSLGATWSSCSPDFGVPGVIDRFGQIEPKVLIVADGYTYAGRTHRLAEKVDAIIERLPGLGAIVTVPFADLGLSPSHPTVVPVAELCAGPPPGEPAFTPLPFDHPLYVLYSSGTTGVPKSIVHGQGGTLLKHLEEHQLQTDLHPGESRLFWFTTTGWMMWNWLVSALASRTTVVLYDGSPVHPDPGVLWRLAERAGVTHFGTSPRFLGSQQKAGVEPAAEADLSAVRAVLSTGAPLNPEQFDWVYAHVRRDVQLASVSGGTDIIGCFAAGAPIVPVRRGELQRRCLGMAVEAWDPSGRPVVGEKGELVCTRPFPSMPVGFFNDPDGTRYRKAYFSAHPGVWTHGDFVELRPEGGVVIYGRSDTTLNPGGVRIGTAEIYRAIEGLPEVLDAIVVGRPTDGDVDVVLCIKLADGAVLDAGLSEKIRSTIRSATTPRHVPRHVFAVRDIPYTISGKKVEQAVRAMLTGEPVGNRDALANPEALDEYARLPFDR